MSTKPGTLSTMSGRLSTRSVKRLSTTSGNKQITVNQNQEKTDNENNAPSLHGDNIVKTIDNQSGFMRYNQELGLWYVYYTVSGKSYEMDRFYSDQFSQEFQQEGAQVVFSGDVYDINIDPKYHYVGQNDYYIHPSKMEMIEEEAPETVDRIE